ncbi:MAG: hypothetical protein HYX71_06080 [Opitutae bacterium]|nr:hypothetical protein [Opitutae bacterium]
MKPGYLLLALLLLASTTALAQPHRQPEERGSEHSRYRGPRVILFQDADYQGASLVVYAGEALENLSSLTFPGGGKINDRISSIRVEGGAEVYVHTDSRFRGEVMRVTENIRDLSGRLLPGSVSASWNDRISSLRVEVRRRDEAREEPDLVIRRAYLDLLARAPDPGGQRTYRSLIIDQGWSERMVRDHLRRSDEFRREGADRIIRRAYLDVLGREPDPTGLKHQRRNLLEKNWTEGDVRDDLRRSDEYRQKTGGHK